MSKIDIGVGEEFPLDERQPDEHGQGRHWRHHGHGHGRHHFHRHGRKALLLAMLLAEIAHCRHRAEGDRHTV